MRVLIPTAVLIISAILIGQVVAAGPVIGPTQGYTVYKITVSGQQLPAESFNVNETVEPSSQSGFVHLTITVVSGVRNATYSNDVNATSLPEVFPYLVGVNNQSLSYGTTGMMDVIRIQNTGSARISFNNKTYDGTRYQVSMSITYSPQALKFEGNGTIITLPSGLVYSAEFPNIDGYDVRAQLLQTSISVDVATASSFPLGIALVTIGLLGAIAFAVPSLFIRWRRKSAAQPAPSGQPQTDEKPSYWVD